MHWILNHIDCFVSQSRGNKNVKQVYLLSHAFNSREHDVWDKVGQAVGNLQSLKRACIEVDLPIVDWEILARILSHVRQRIIIDITDVLAWDAEEPKFFARAIHGHPTITSFENIIKFPYESLDALYSILATLPALEWVSFAAPEVRQADESTLAYPESLTELLRVPTLRFVRFYSFSFTPALFQATANALMEGTAVTKLEFMECSFSAVECDVTMTNGLSRNASVISIIARQCNNARALFNTIRRSGFSVYITILDVFS
jgi:hypothetical protein